MSLKEIYGASAATQQGANDNNMNDLHEDMQNVLAANMVASLTNSSETSSQPETEREEEGVKAEVAANEEPKYGYTGFWFRDGHY